VDLLSTNEKKILNFNFDETLQIVDTKAHNKLRAIMHTTCP